MSLRIIYGRAGCGKTEQIIEQISSIVSSNNTDKIIYLVPEQYSLESEQKIASAFGGGSASRVDALSFARLSNRVFSKFGPLYEEYITPSGRHMILQKAILDIKKHLNILSICSRLPDFAASIANQISELKRNNITPERLLEISNTLPSSQLRLKLQDLSLIYEKYNSLISEPYGDAENNLNILCDKIETHNLFTDTHFFLDEFSDFTPQELSVVAMLLAKCKSVTVALTSDSLSPSAHGIDVFALQKHSAKQLSDLALARNIEVLPPVFLGTNKKFNNRPELCHLEKNFFLYPAKKYLNKTQEISIFEANSPRGEVILAAKTILRLCRKKGFKFKDFAIFTRNASTYSKDIRDVFEQYGISVFCDEKETSLRHPLSQLPLALLELFIYNFNYDVLFKYIKLGYSGLTPAQIYLLENYALASGISKKQWLSSSPLTFLPKGFNADDLENVNISKSIITAHFSSFYDKLKSCKSVSQIINVLYETLISIDAQDVSRYRGEYADKALPVWNAVIDTFDQMNEFLGDSQVTLEKFHSILISGLESTEISSIPLKPDRVHFGSLDRFKGYTPRVLFLLGTLDGALPKSFRQDGLLSDSDRKVLSLSTDSTSRQLAEQNLIYHCITAPKDLLFIFYPLANSEGDATVISPVVKRVRQLFPEITTYDNLYIKPNTADEVEGLSPTFKAAISKLKHPDDIWQFILNWYKENYTNDFLSAEAVLQHDLTQKKLSQEALNSLYGVFPKMSVSHIEQFAKCQFSHFLKYGINAEKRHEHKLSAADTGSFMHEIISTYSNSISDWKAITKKTCFDKISKITNAVLPDDKRVFSKIYPVMSTTAWSITQFYQKSSFKPLGFELLQPTMSITLDNRREIKLSGRIDRIDICGNHISVIDYKSSAKDIDFSQLSCGLQIQLPVYLAAICREKKSSPAAILYAVMDSPVISASSVSDDADIEIAVQSALKMRGLVLDDDEVIEKLGENFIQKNTLDKIEFEKLCEFAVSTVKKELEKVFSGEIMINPFQSSCDYCSYQSICQFDGERYRTLRKLKKEEFEHYVEKLDS